MDGITNRGLDDRFNHRLHIRAAQHGCTVDDWAKTNNGEGAGGGSVNNLLDAIRSEVEEFCGVELQLPPAIPFMVRPTSNYSKLHQKG